MSHTAWVGVAGGSGVRVVPHLIVIWFVVTKCLRLTAAAAADDDSFVALTPAGLSDAAALHLGAKFRVLRVEVLVSA